MSFATLLGESGLVGEFGKGFSYFNYEVFGIIAPCYPIMLLYPLYIYYKYGKFDTKHTQNILASIVSVVVLLCVQYLWFKKGVLAESVVNFLNTNIGFLGIYAILIILGIFAWILFSIDNFLKVMQKIPASSIKLLEKLGAKVSSFFKTLTQRKKEKPFQPEQKAYPFDIDIKEEDFLQGSDNAAEKPKQAFEKESFIDVEPQVRVFYDIKLQTQEEKPNIIEVKLDNVENQRDYSQEVMRRNKKLSQAFLQGNFNGEETRVENPAQNIDIDMDFLYSNEQGRLRQQAKTGSSKNITSSNSFDRDEREIQTRHEDFGVMQEVQAEAQDFITQNNKKNATSPARASRKSRIQVVKEVSQNAMLLDDLDKGEVERPKNYLLPSLDLLTKPPVQDLEIDEDEIDAKAQNLIEKLKTFKIDGDVVTICSGPLISTFEFKPANHVKVSRISNLSDDLAMALSAQSIRIQAPIPGKNVVGIEIPNSSFQTVYMREILESEIFKQSASPLTLALGKDIAGNPFVTDLKKLPHLLVAGTTGSGKSVGVNAMIISLLYRNSPDNLRLIMIDPKMVEFSLYEDIPHLLTPIVTDPKKAIAALNQAAREMEKRYKMMQELKVKTIESYNQKCKERGLEPFAYLVIIIDELADLMMTGGKEAEAPIIRVAQMGRACGMHLIVATQRPSADVVTGLIKTNLPSRIAFKVSNKIDSRVIIDTEGAQSLLGRGDMLFAPGATNATRIHAPWTSEKEIEEIVGSIKMQREVIYDEDFDLEGKELLSQNTIEGGNVDDEDLQKAKEIMLTSGKTSASFLQRQMRIGYNKAANLVEELERQGFLSVEDSKGKRSIVGR